MKNSSNSKKKFMFFHVISYMFWLFYPILSQFSFSFLMLFNSNKLRSSENVFNWPKQMTLMVCSFICLYFFIFLALFICFLVFIFFVNEFKRKKEMNFIVFVCAKCFINSLKRHSVQSRKKKQEFSGWKRLFVFGFFTLLYFVSIRRNCNKR